jgi:hypothetical protein
VGISICERTPAMRNFVVPPIRKSVPLYVGSQAVAIQLICECEMTNRSAVREERHVVVILEDGLYVSTV